MITFQELTLYDLKEMKFHATPEAARPSMMFAPMLCKLFVATRMHALQMADNKGAPQAWAQDGMFTSTWATLFSLVMF